MRLFKDFTGISRHPAAANASDRHRPRRRRCPLGLEQLEDRVALSTFVVTNLDDSGNGSLRQAIEKSNSTPGPNEIDFAPGLSGTITLTSGELAINKDLNIVGPGANAITVSGNHADRVFEIVHAVNVAISGLTIANGRHDGGGGILNSGTLILTNSTISDNSVSNFSTGEAGGIANFDTLTVIDSTITGNSAGQGGAIVNENFGVPSRLTITRSIFSDNSAHDAFGGAGGGAIDNLGALTISDSTFSGDTAMDFGGGINNRGGEGIMATINNSTFSGNTATLGGGIFNSGLMTLTGSTLSGNFAADRGGGIFNTGLLTLTDSTLDTNTATGGAGGSGSGGGLYNDLGTLTITDSLISGNSADRDGGGLYNNSFSLTITDSTLSGNSADRGGGIYNAGLLAIAGSTLSDNSAVENGGGISNDGGGLALAGVTIRRNSAAHGGGIFNTNGGVLAIVASDISDNESGDLVDLT
jgi:hypothetical protein